MSDPTRVWKRREHATLAIGIAALVTLLVWALRPLHPVEPIDISITTPARDDGGTDKLVPLDRSAFAAPIWNPETAPASAASTTTAQDRAAPPVRLQLLGIVHDTDGEGVEILRAAIYDPAADTLHIVTSGEVIAGITISTIDNGGVVLETGGHTSRLALRDEHSAGGQR